MATMMSNDKNNDDYDKSEYNYTNTITNTTIAIKTKILASA